MSTAQLAEEIATLPTNLQEEVQDFVAFLKSKALRQPQPPLQKRQFGAAKGFFVMSDDFDEPLEDFKDYM
ncbi:type II toxin-antitoxin system VapB family antitoxin [Hymenobacter arcticus]